jgi:hypothetical protein
MVPSISNSLPDIRKEHRDGVPVPVNFTREVPAGFARSSRNARNRTPVSFHILKERPVMKTRNFAIAGAALLLLATPAMAGQSTAAEREATRQLNLQAAQQAQSSNQASTPQPQFADAAANLPAGSPPAAAPTAQVQSAPIANPDATAPKSP